MLPMSSKSKDHSTHGREPYSWSLAETTEADRTDGCAPCLLTKSGSQTLAMLFWLLAAMVMPVLAGPPDVDPVQLTSESPKDQPAPSVVLVEGQVTDSLGGGHAGVSVRAYRKGVGDDPGELIGETESGEFGDFTLRVSEAIEADIVVVFRADGYADLRREARVGDKFPPFLAETLTGKNVVIGRVVDENNQPVAGAAVSLSAAYSDWHEKTDDDGTFTIKGVVPGEGELTVEAKGFGRERVTIVRMEEFGEVVVTLDPERVLHIKVVDQHHKAIDRVIVEAYDQPHEDFRTVVTDKYGEATLAGWHFDAALIKFRLTHEDYVSSEQFDREIVTPEREARSTHQFVMHRAGRIAGRVTDSKSGDPVNGARFLIGAAGDDNRPRDWSDFRGRFEVTGVAPGRAVVTVHAAGYAPDLSIVEVKGAETAQLDLKLVAGATLSGTVRTDGGDPAMGLTVETGVWRKYRTLDLRSIVDDDGRVTIEDVPLDEFEIQVIVRGQGAILTKTVRGDRKGEIEWVVPADAISAKPGGLAMGATAPVIKVKTLDGTAINLKNLRGKTVVLDYWATWCAPCVAELPHLLALYEKFSKRDDFFIIGISLDGNEKAFRDFVAEKKLPWSQVFGDAGGAQDAADRYGVEALPALFVIDPEGKIVGRDWHGARLVKKVQQVLEDNDPT